MLTGRTSTTGRSTAEFSAKPCTIHCRMADISMGIEEEVAEFIRNERPLWPQTATSCPVQQCRDGHKFSSFNDFIIHWREMHHETDTRYKCKLCKRSYGTLKHKKSHEKSKCHTGQTVEFETIKIQNPRYIDPKDELPYKLGSTNYRKKNATNSKTATRRTTPY